MDGSTATAETRPHRFTVADFYRMADVGIFNEDSRVELIKGQIVDMAAIGTPHAATVNRLNRALTMRLIGRATISIQNPLRLDDRSEPQPDVVVLRPREDDYVSAHPGPADALLLIEVADTTLRYDQLTKAPLYAESGVSELWIVDLGGGAIEVYREPQDGEYGHVHRVGRDGSLSIAALPDFAIPAAEILPD